jgi:hypothetical protein
LLTTAAVLYLLVTQHGALADGRPSQSNTPRGSVLHFRGDNTKPTMFTAFHGMAPARLRRLPSAAAERAPPRLEPAEVSRMRSRALLQDSGDLHMPICEIDMVRAASPSRSLPSAQPKPCLLRLPALPLPPCWGTTLPPHQKRPLLLVNHLNLMSLSLKCRCIA